MDMVGESTGSAGSVGFGRIALVIPAYNPDPALGQMVEDLSRFGFCRIIVVNDGSSGRSSAVFSRMTSIPNVILMQHESNRGKGAALKTAFEYIAKEQHEKVENCITVDADGQHSIEDVLKIARESARRTKTLILGVRDFSGSVPLRSRFGNTMTKYVLRFAGFINLKDTQTGLRSLPLQLMKAAIEIAYDRYEFEMECLLLSQRLGIEIAEVPIRTIYIGDNKSSHFRPIVDSMRIYLVFLRFGFASLASFALDIGTFIALYSLSSNIIASTYGARIISGTFNFLCNKYLVFLSPGQKGLLGESIAYIILALMVATASGLAVNALSARGGLNNVAITKVGVDVLLFFSSFFLQRFVVFRYFRS